tara:strand:- start:38199 stop:38384 length:186 start_codon:yes stop_codon:yes gene_type:complete
MSYALTVALTLLASEGCRWLVRRRRNARHLNLAQEFLDGIVKHANAKQRANDAWMAGRPKR